MKLFNRINAFLFTALMGLLIASIFGLPPFITIAVLTAVSLFIVAPKGVALMAIQREIWERDIVANLFKNNEFAKRAFNADIYVLEGRVVHIPVAGTPSAVNKNVTNFPVQAVKRTDADIIYSIDTYYTVPRHIERIETYELAYDKRQSVLGEDQSALIQASMDGMLFRWAPGAANVIETAGAAGAPTVFGATGTRNTFTKVVFSTIKLKMDRANIPFAGRVALLTADHHQQLLDSFSDIEKTNFHNLADATNGIIGRYLGIDIMMRSSVQRYRKVATVWTPVDEQDPAFTASDKTGDSAASLFYYDQAVERALGTVQMFDGANRPEYYGDIFSFILRMGGRIRRNEGVYAIVEAIAS